MSRYPVCYFVILEEVMLKRLRFVSSRARLGMRL